MSLLSVIREELPVIRQAPWTICLSALVLTGAASAGVYSLFNVDLSAKNSLISTLSAQVTALQREVDSLKNQTQTVTSDHQSATKFLPAQPVPAVPPKIDRSVKIGGKNEFTNSLIVTGDGNTVNVNPSTPGRTLTAQQESRLEALVKSIGPQEIGFRHSQGNDEAQRFSDKLQEIIVARAGWKLKRPKFLIAQRETYGVWVFVKSADKPPPAAIMLLDALNDKDIALGAKGIEIPDLQPDAIDIMIGLQEIPPSLK